MAVQSVEAAFGLCGWVHDLDMSVCEILTCAFPRHTNNPIVANSCDTASNTLFCVESSGAQLLCLEQLGSNTIPHDVNHTTECIGNLTF